MRTVISLLLVVSCMALAQTTALAQTETTPAIARQTFVPQAEARIPVLPPRVVSPPVVADAVVVERIPSRVVPGAVPRVTERIAPAAVIREQAVIPQAALTWRDTFAQARYGFYDDAYVDDNWYYDYYDLARPVAAVIAPTGRIGHRTAWSYEPIAERGMFSW